MIYKHWTKKENVINEAKKYASRKEFYTNASSAYYAALKLGIINKFTWFENKINYDEKDCIYAYIFEDLKYAYVGRTLANRLNRRDKEHFYKNKNEATYRFIKEHNVERIPLKILETNITVKDGIEREKYWAEFYKNLGYTLINSRPCGGVGSLGGGIWDDDNVELESKKYKSRGEFAKNSPSAYNYARKNKLLERFTWLHTQMDKELGFWNTKENVIKESKKYKTRTEFYTNCSPAYRSAIKHQWIDELTWLKNERKVKRGFWTDENLKKEASKYATKQELLKNNKSAYVTAHKKGLLDLFYSNEK